jgi:hypothetical protein
MMIFFSHQNTVLRGSGVANFEKPAVGSVSRYRLDNPPLIDMEVQIHQLEQDAYSAVLRAFKAQSDALTWVCVYLVSSINFCYIMFIYSCFEELSPVF